MAASQGFAPPQRGVQRGAHVVQRRVFDLVPVGQAVHAAVAQVHVHVVALLQRVRVRLRVLAAPLEVLAADEAGVDVLIGEEDATV